MASQAAAVLGRKRWEGTKEQRAAHALLMNAARDAGKTKKQISAQARAAVNARWKRVKEAGGKGGGEPRSLGSQEGEPGSGRSDRLQGWPPLRGVMTPARVRHSPLWLDVLTCS